MTFELPAECSSTRHLTGQINGVFYDGEVNGITLSPTGLYGITLSPTGLCVSVFGCRSSHLIVPTSHLFNRGRMDSWGTSQRKRFLGGLQCSELRLPNRLGATVTWRNTISAQKRTTTPQGIPMKTSPTCYRGTKLFSLWGWLVRFHWDTNDHHISWHTTNFWSIL